MLCSYTNGNNHFVAVWRYQVRPKGSLALRRVKDQQGMEKKGLVVGVLAVWFLLVLAPQEGSALATSWRHIVTLGEVFKPGYHVYYWPTAKGNDLHLTVTNELSYHLCLNFCWNRNCSRDGVIFSGTFHPPLRNETSKDYLLADVITSEWWNSRQYVVGFNGSCHDINPNTTKPMWSIPFYPGDVGEKNFSLTVRGSDISDVNLTSSAINYFCKFSYRNNFTEEVLYADAEFADYWEGYQSLPHTCEIPPFNNIYPVNTPFTMAVGILPSRSTLLKGSAILRTGPTVLSYNYSGCSGSIASFTGHFEEQTTYACWFVPLTEVERTPSATWVNESLVTCPLPTQTGDVTDLYLGTDVYAPFGPRTLLHVENPGPVRHC